MTSASMVCYLMYRLVMNVHWKFACRVTDNKKIFIDFELTNPSAPILEECIERIWIFNVVATSLGQKSMYNFESVLYIYAWIRIGFAICVCSFLNDLHRSGVDNRCVSYH